MNIENYSPKFDEFNDDSYNEFDEFENLDTIKVKPDNINTNQDLFDVMQNDITDNTKETSDLLSSALELDEIYEEISMPKLNLKKKEIKKNETNTNKEFKKTKKIKTNKKDIDIENYKYAA